MGFGERLQREREMRHITLDEIASATKIGSRALRALEQEDFSKLPGGIFNKGFVRAYARYLGIDEDEAVADYMAAIGDQGEPASDNDRLKKLEANWQPHKEGDGGTSIRVPWLGIVILVLLSAALFAGWHYRHQGIERFREWRARQHHSGQQTSAPATGTTVTPGPLTAAPPRTTSAGPSPPAAIARTPTPAPSAFTKPKTPPHPLVLQIRAVEDSWISVVADGHSVFRGILSARGSRTVSARRKIALTAGNAGGVELVFDGSPVPKLGEPAQVRSVMFTSNGVQPENVTKGLEAAPQNAH